MTSRFIGLLSLEIWMFPACCFVLPLWSSAQEIRIFSQADSSIVPGAYVLLLHHSDTLGIEASDENGLVDLKAYFTKVSAVGFCISYVGFERHCDSVFANDHKTVFLKEDKRLLGELVVTGQYGDHHASRSVNKITVINRERIESQGAVNLADVLAKEANIRISQDNVLGGGLSVQGLSGQNVKILIDGVPMIGRLDGNIDINQINLNDVERIEIVEGPMAVEYGSNALGCTINIITCKKKDERIHASVHGFYETTGQYNTDLTLALSHKKQDFHLNFGRNYFDGWSPSDPFIQFPKVTLADTLRTDQWNPKEQYFAKINWTIKSEKSSFRFYSHFFHEFIENRGMPRKPYFETAFDDHYRTLRTDAGFDWQKETAGKFKWQLLVGYNFFERTKNTWFVDLTTLQKTLSLDSQDQDTSEFRLLSTRATLSSPQKGNVRWMLGYDINLESAKGQRISDETQLMFDAAIFGGMEWMPDKNFTIRPGLRYAYNSLYHAPLVPSVHIRKSIGSWILRASYAHGFRAPSLKELYFEFVDINHNIFGNAFLKAEQSQNMQLFLQRQWIRKKSFLRWENGVFYNAIRDLITLAQIGTNGSYSYINIGRYETAGIRSGGEWKNEKMSIAAELVFTGFRSELSEAYGHQGFVLSPEYKFTGTCFLSKWKGRLAMFYKFNGRVVNFYYEDETLAQGQLSSNDLLDLTYTQSLLKEKLQIQIGGRNLFNVTNLMFSGASGAHTSGSGSVPFSWGRSLIFSITWKMIRA